MSNICEKVTFFLALVSIRFQERHVFLIKTSSLNLHFVYKQSLLELYFLFRPGILHIPDHILVNIFSHLPLCELLPSICRVCKRFNSLIDNVSRLYKDFTFNYALTFHTRDLAKVLRHSASFERFIIPHGTIFQCTVPELDYILTKHFRHAPSLYWMGLYNCPISTLGFLTAVPNIQFLQIKGCDNLQVCDFLCLKSCHSLEQLYLPFAKIDPETVITIVEGKSLTVLDVSGIEFDIDECIQVLNLCYNTLIVFNLSLSVSEDNFRRNIEDFYIDCSFSICRNTTV
jgi:hypothetical protein